MFRLSLALPAHICQYLMTVIFECVIAAFLASAAYPLWRGWRAARASSLRHPLAWAWAAYLLSLGTNLGQIFLGFAPQLEYARLVVLMSPLVALLGARRPGAAAWNFVVAGWLAVAGLALIDQSLQSERPADWRLDGPRCIFVACVLAVGVINYLPTGQWFAAVLAGLLGGLEIGRLCASGDALSAAPGLSAAAFAVAAWWACRRLVRLKGRAPTATVEWLIFRDCLGVVWSKPLQEQFNRAAAHARLDATLTWHGIATASSKGELAAELEEQALALLRSLTRRFGVTVDRASGNSAGHQP